MSANKSPANFARPAEFLPERWLPSSPFPNDIKAAFQPFSVGPRSCIGKILAYAEMRLILARLLWNFNLESPVPLSDSLDWTTQKIYMMVEKQPFYVRLMPV
jgi:cytochrome P450